MTENAIAKEIVDAAFRIHTTLGPGLLESVYHTVLAYELGRRGLRTVRQQPIPVVYENIRIDTGFRADLVVEDKAIVEIKSVESLAPVHKKQSANLYPAGRQASWLTHQLSCGLHQRRHHARRQWTRRRFSRQVAKPPRRVGTPRHPLLGISRAQPLAILRRSQTITWTISVWRKGNRLGAWDSKRQDFTPSRWTP